MCCYKCLITQFILVNIWAIFLNSSPSVPAIKSNKYTVTVGQRVLSIGPSIAVGVITPAYTHPSTNQYNAIQIDVNVWRVKDKAHYLKLVDLDIDQISHNIQSLKYSLNTYSLLYNNFLNWISLVSESK